MARYAEYSHLINMMVTNAMVLYSLDDLLAIMQRLRLECPWDKAQTPLSLTRYAIEEAYEVEAAIRDGDTLAIKDELGDLLLQVVFQSQMFSETNTLDTQLFNGGTFNFADVVQQLSEKLVRRHPHVFGDNKLQHAAQVNEVWEQVKLDERGGVRRRLDEVKPSPSLMQAQALQKQAAKVGFDWPDVQGAQAKLKEEIGELAQAIEAQDIAQISDELGDCLFALVNVARKLNVQSETALLGTIHKFRQRFAYIEDQLALQHKTPEQSNLQEMDALWDAAKRVLAK